MRANALADQHRAIAEKFAELAQARGDQQPVFAIEHELDEVALGELRRTVSEHLEGDPQLTSAAWSWGYLPLVVIATEVGYRYRGTGTDFWPVLSLELGIEANIAFRNGLSRFFELGNSKYRLERPSDSPWELHFPNIAWPIGNSVVPLEIQPQLTDALRRAVRAGISADGTDMLLEYIRSLAAGHASRRFENWLLRKDLALEVMRRLLAPGTPGWLSNGIISRIDRDIRKDWGAFRAITEARRALAKKSARLAQITPARFGLVLHNGAPKQVFIRGPVLPAHFRDDVITSLRIHGDRIRAVDGIHAVPLGLFLSGGEISVKTLFPFTSSPLRRDDALEVGEGTAGSTMERLQPLQAEFFVLAPDDLTASAIFPTDRLQPDCSIIQCLRGDDEGNIETRLLDTSSPSDVEFLRRSGFAVEERTSNLQVLGMHAPGSKHTFLDGFPLLVTQRGVNGADLLLNGSDALGEAVSLRGLSWKAIRPSVGRHVIELVDGREADRLDFEIIEPADIEPAAIKLLPAHANAFDLESGQLEIRITAPLPLEAVPIRIRVTLPNEPTLTCAGVIERLPARITGRSPLLHTIQTQLSGLQASVSGLRMSVEVGGLMERVFSLPPVRRELRYDGDTGEWTRIGDDALKLPLMRATADAPLLKSAEHDRQEIRLVLPDAADHEALTAGLILRGRASTRIGLRDFGAVSLPPLLREPASSETGVGLVDVARAYIAWQLAETKDLLCSWHRWSAVEILESALVDQLCGPAWRRLEAEIDPSFSHFNSALLYFISKIWDDTKGDRPAIDQIRYRDFLHATTLKRISEVIPNSQNLVTIDDDLAGALDVAMEDAYESLQEFIESEGGTPEFSGAVGFLTTDWQSAIKRAGEAQKLSMFKHYILPEPRWSALIKPFYGELTEDDLVDLLDSAHTDAFRRPGLRWLGRAELRIMLQLWLSPKAMVETDGWRNLLSKGLSDLHTTRAVRYVALRQKLALGDLPEAGG
jgi:hypothetical protein